MYILTYMYMFVNKANISNYIIFRRKVWNILSAFCSMEPLQKYLIIATLPNAKYVHLLSPASADIGVPY